MHLTECFAPLISYILDFRRSAGEGLPVERLRSAIDLLLSQGEERGRGAGIPPELYDAGRFAVCAWADKVILNSRYPQRDAWLNDQLQHRYCGTSDAGEEFFDRLGDLSLKDHEVREVYYLCLSLGFTGRYRGGGGDEALARLRSAELTVLCGSCAPEEEHDLFPGGYPQDLPASGRQAVRFSFSTLPVVTTVAVPILCFVILLVVFRFALTGMADNLLRGLPF